MFKKIASTFIAKILTAIINLVIAVLISRWAGAEVKGIHGLFIATLAMVITLMGVFGVVSLTYLIPRKKTANYIIIAHIWSVIVSIAVFFFLKAFPLVPEEFRIQLSLICFLASAASNNLSIYLVKERITFYNLAIFSQPLLNIAIIFILYFWRGEFLIEDYLLSLAISYAALLTFSIKGLFIFYKEKFFINIESFYSDVKDMFRYGFINQAAAFIQMFSFRGSFYILDAYSSTTDVGIYSNAVSIAESVWLISRSLSLVFYARMINTTSIEYHKRIFQRFSFLAFWMQAIAILVLVLIPGDFYELLFGSEFVGLKWIIISLLPATLFFGQSLISGHYFSGSGKHHINLISSICGVIVVISLCYVLIPNFGSIGAGVATSLGYGILLLVQSIYLKKYIKISVFSKVLSIRSFALWKRLFLKK
jgi:O-antigen/teichoic acid export membrane protein